MAGEITIRCKRTIVGAKAVQPGNFYHFSALDRTMEPNVVRIVCYYHLPSCSRTDGATEYKLIDSLSEVLTSYPPVTGRLKRTPEGNWVIKCNDAGVRMMEATARGSMEEWLEMVNRERELKLTFWEDMYEEQYFWSTFYVQLTRFEGGGLAIGLSCSHLLADATSAAALMKAWADAHLIGKMLSPPYFHPLPCRRRLHINKCTGINNGLSDDLTNYYRYSLSMTRPISLSNLDSCVTITFVFSDDMVRKCMACACARTTPFEAVAALFWVGIWRVRGRREGLVSMSIGLDVRKVLGLSRDFFGNAMIYAGVEGEAVEGGRIDTASKAIGDAVKKINYEEVMNLIEWLESKPNVGHPMLSSSELVCVNLEGLQLNDAMFDVGLSPIRASCYLDNASRGQILILSDNSLSRVVMVTLPQEQGLKLCEEEFIFQFSPTIMMKG